MSKVPKKSIEVVIKKENPEFMEEAQKLSAAELEARLAQCAKDSEGVEEAKEKDDELEEAKAKVTHLRGAYTDAKKAIRLKSRYIIHLLKEKGAF